jgi:hypothetical protein
MIFHSIISAPFRQNRIVKLLFSRNKLSSNIYFVNIDPAKIKYISYISESSPFLIGPQAYTGVYDGLWDKMVYPFEKNIIFRLARVIISGGSVEKSFEYRYVKNRLSKKEVDWMIHKLANFVEIFSRDGYLSQYELKQIQRSKILSVFSIPRNETIIGMDRNGDYIRLVGGRHRLAIAQNMKIKEMPAILSLIHADNKTSLPEKSRLITGNEEDFRPF